MIKNVMIILNDDDDDKYQSMKSCPPVCARALQSLPLSSFCITLCLSLSLRPPPTLSLYPGRRRDDWSEYQT